MDVKWKEGKQRLLNGGQKKGREDGGSQRAQKNRKEILSTWPTALLSVDCSHPCSVWEYKHTCTHMRSWCSLPTTTSFNLSSRSPSKSFGFLFAFFLSLKLSIPSFVLFWFFGSRKFQHLWRTHCNVIWRELYNSFPPLSTPQDLIFIIHARKKEKKQLGKGSQLGWSSLEAQVSLYWALCLVS